jgi:hypothetical protein
LHRKPSQHRETNSTDFPWVCGTAASNGAGSAFLGGIQAGWNYQVGKLVVGADFDWSATRLKGHSVGVLPPGFLPSTTETFDIRTNWTATTTTTFGLANTAG